MDDLTRAQEALGRAIGRARVGEDRELANTVRELGERLAHLLSGLLRMSRLHSPDNRAFDQPVAEVRATLVRLGEILGAVHLVAVEDQVYVNDIRIRGSEKASSLRELGQELQRHNVGGITLHEPLDDAGVRSLVRALGAAPAAQEPRGALARALQEAGLGGIELQGRFRFRLAGEATTADPGEEAGQLVPRVLAAADEAFANLAAGRVPNPLPLRRLVSEVLRRDLASAELWADPKDDSAWALHAWRVCLGALVIGRALALPESTLQDLGVAALYHDAGYGAEEARGAEPAAAFAMHAAAGARAMLRQRGFHEAKTRRVLALLHHHRDAGETPPPPLLARVLRIAEDYDTLARRTGRLSPTMALALMAKWSGARYDAALLQLFLNALGAYPPGTLLQTEDGRVFRSVAPARGPGTFAAPLARLVRGPDGTSAPDDAAPVELQGAGRLQVLRPSA
jgi:HD-GYP domain-containing protein (c-di-GMP phosphodiesterase class II)